MVGTSGQREEALLEVEAAIFLLTTFGYIDGDFAEAEQGFVRASIARNVEPGMRDDAAAMFEAIHAQIAELFTESVAHSETQADFVYTRLKTKCYEVFQAFDAETQGSLLDLLDELLLADGQVHPAEVRFRAELAELLEADLGVKLVEEAEDGPRMVLRPPAPGPVGAEPTAHPFFDPLERHYPRDPGALQAHVARDLALMDRVADLWAGLRAAGRGTLEGRRHLAELVGEPAFLDGHVHGAAPTPGSAHELTVLGDLHGCYSCLKAALLQSRFLDRVAAWQADPAGSPYPLLVMLGDYIDRGIYSFNGVLRAALELLLRAPEHVVVLRGNHEHFIEVGERVIGGVKPAEAIATLKPHLPDDVFRRYRQFFEQMPVWLLFDRTVFVHGGIPRDATLAARWRDLSSLNDPEIRLEALWSDPASVDFIPRALQAKTNRFPFGRMQAQAFLRRMGARALIRGHEKVQEGFRRVYDDGAIVLCTLFSAGGERNADLPEQSSYRKVTPMALTLRRAADGQTELVPWPIDYAPYNAPERNAFFQGPPEIEHTVA